MIILLEILLGPYHQLCNYRLVLSSVSCIFRYSILWPFTGMRAAEEFHHFREVLFTFEANHPPRILTTTNPLCKLLTPNTVPDVFLSFSPYVCVYVLSPMKCVIQSIDSPFLDDSTCLIAPNRGLLLNVNNKFCC